MMRVNRFAMRPQMKVQGRVRLPVRVREIVTDESLRSGGLPGVANRGVILRTIRIGNRYLASDKASSHFPSVTAEGSDATFCNKKAL